MNREHKYKDKDEYKDNDKDKEKFSSKKNFHPKIFLLKLSDFPLSTWDEHSCTLV